MMRLSATLLFVVCTLSSGVVAAAQAPDPATTTEDIKAAFEKGDYQETLKLLSRVLSLKGKAAQGIDRYSLLMMRAESYLKLKTTSLALEALEEAEKVARAADDEKGAADARALTMLIKRSRNLQFTPKVAVGERKALAPIDITDVNKRPEAMEALYAEEKVAVKPLVQAADKSRNRSLLPVAKAIKAVSGLKDLEVAATGKDAETAETIKDLVDRAQKLMARGLDDMTRRTERIAERADELVEKQVIRENSVEYVTRRRGVDTNESKELKQIVEDCKRVAQSCKELTESFTDDTEPFDDLQDQALDTAERATEVLRDSYTRR
jgi:hypothetical protein